MLKMAKYEFAELDKWAKKSKNRMLTIAQTATQDVIDEAQKTSRQRREYAR